MIKAGSPSHAAAAAAIVADSTGSELLDAALAEAIATDEDKAGLMCRHFEAVPTPYIVRRGTPSAKFCCKGCAIIAIVGDANRQRLQEMRAEADGHGGEA